MSAPVPGTSPEAGKESPYLDAAYAFFSHARFARALSLLIIGTAFGTHLLRSIMGQAGLTTVLVSEVVLVGLMLSARRRMVIWSAFTPISLALFVLWCGVTIAWSWYPAASFAGWVSQITFALLALAIAASRDTIQIIRALGDVLRVLLGTSLVLEVIAGAFIDGPIGFLDIKGNLINGLGIQGVFGSRNALSTIALLALATFVIEWRTKSVTQFVSIVSVSGAALCLLLASSPVGFTVLISVGFIALVLMSLRRLSPGARNGAEIVVAVVAGILLIVVWIFRNTIVDLMSASGPLNYRLAIWQQMWKLGKMHTLEGWGWVGPWPWQFQPFWNMNLTSGDIHASGLNAYLDVWFQTGLVGLVLLIITLGLAFIRSWQLASSKKSEIYLWAPLILATMMISGLAESTLLFEWGWLVVVIVAARASKEQSWRKKD